MTQRILTEAELAEILGPRPVFTPEGWSTQVSYLRAVEAAVLSKVLGDTIPEGGHESVGLPSAYVRIVTLSDGTRVRWDTTSGMWYWSGVRKPFYGLSPFGWAKTPEDARLLANLVERPFAASKPDVPK